MPSFDQRELNAVMLGGIYLLVGRLLARSLPVSAVANDWPAAAAAAATAPSVNSITRSLADVVGYRAGRMDRRMFCSQPLPVRSVDMPTRFTMHNTAEARSLANVHTLLRKIQFKIMRFSL